MNEHEDALLRTLFRQEFARMVAVVSKHFGLAHIEIAEDLVSGTFLKAAESWKTNLPENPAAWLYTVAKHDTLRYLKREKTFTEKILPHMHQAADATVDSIPLDISAENIKDSQLKMIFAICDPCIMSEAQIALALRILCGFSIDEIAEAFFTPKDTIHKRLHRAKEKLRQEGICLELPPVDHLAARLDNVLHTLYLLFNEGYYSSTHNGVLRQDFCMEALRLGLLLTEFSQTNTPPTNALVALMSFHASRLAARQSPHGEVVLYDDQDITLWNQDLIMQGTHYLNLCAQGTTLTSYHLEAGIAFWHSQPQDTHEKWQHILLHYDWLLAIRYSPTAAMNRLYAYAKIHGKAAALTEAHRLNLPHHQFYHVLMSYLYEPENLPQAIDHLQKAYTLARTQADKTLIQQRMQRLLKLS